MSVTYEDIGSTYSRVAYRDWNISDTKVFANDAGHRLIPSCVAFTESGPIVGSAARLWGIKNPETTICNPRALLGRRWSDPKVQALIRDLPYRVLSDHEDKLLFEINVGGDAKAYTPEYVTSLIIRELKHMAGAHFSNGEKATEAIFAIPYYDDNYQRQAIEDAGKLAGVDARRILSEPGAALLAYDLNEEYGERNVVILDIGDTLGVYVMNVDQVIFEQLAISHHDIGGKGFTRRIVDRLVALWKEKTDTDLTAYPTHMRELDIQAEKAKIALSSENATIVNLGFIHPDFTYNLTRSEFEELGADLFTSIMEVIPRVLAEANVNIADIDYVLLTGGSGSIPMIGGLVRRVFSNTTLVEGLKDEAVVIGAARTGAILSEAEEGFMCDYIPDYSPLGLGIETADGFMATIAPRDMIPMTRRWNLTTATDGQSSMLIRVRQGERLLAANNLFIGEFELPLTPTPAGVSRVQVTLKVERDGLVNVSATDLATNTSEYITINRLDTWTEERGLPSGMVSDYAFLGNWPKWNDPEPERRALFDARVDLESYLAALKERLTDHEEWGPEDTMRHSTLGYPIHRSEILRDIGMVQKDLIRYRDIWELEYLQELKEAFSHL
ncbi:hypothetical protein NUW58_g5821 [Xylaria curta]|uniref:Uncharacterized protein n=1 Tax=Xylaria curta TaxID=42375 RepID=A0ACC1P1Z5_9PEZI|nr:hypothetical protein NUW58_g5821 [Xylaria curta]